jgi:FAD/FMN-containing dehydrogenase
LAIADSTLSAPARELGRGLHGEVLLDGDDGYDAARSVWNAAIDRHPAVIVRPRDAKDVAAGIGFAREHGLDLSVRCGGHSPAGHAVADGGLMLDLSAMRGVRVDTARREARVGGGALLRDVDRATEPHGLATTGGEVSHTGVAGLTLGGGQGWLGRRLGLACDNLIAAQVVTAAGDILTASESENADLLWGLRGGGGNFGVVTEFTFRLHPIRPVVYTADAFYPTDDGPAVMRGFRDLAAEAPDSVTFTAWVGTPRPEWDFIPADARTQELVSIGLVAVDDAVDDTGLAEPLRRVARPVALVEARKSYVELQSQGDGPMAHGMRRYWKGHFIDFTDAAIDAFLARGGPDGTRANGGIETRGGAISRVPEDDTAYSNRDVMFDFMTAAGWTDPGEDEAIIGAVRRYADALEPFARGVYVNALLGEGDAGVRSAYPPAKLARLVALKERYDPDNVFHLNHNIRPSPRG